MFVFSVSLRGFILYFRFDGKWTKKKGDRKEKRKLTIAVVVVCVRFRWIIVIDRRKEVSSTCSPQYPEHLVRQLTEFTSSFPSQRTPTNFYFSNVVCKFLLRSFVVFPRSVFFWFWFSSVKSLVFADSLFCSVLFFKSEKFTLGKFIYFKIGLFFLVDETFHLFLCPRNKVFAIKEWFLLLFPLVRVFYGSFVGFCLEISPSLWHNYLLPPWNWKCYKPYLTCEWFSFCLFAVATMLVTIGIKMSMRVGWATCMRLVHSLPKWCITVFDCLNLLGLGKMDIIISHHPQKHNIRKL